jgi:hypothetical protein
METVLRSKSFKLGLVAVVVTSVAGAGVVIIVRKVLDKAKLEKAKKAWAEAGQDVVVLHQFGRPSTSLSASPFPAKLEAFLRIAKIKYVCDYSYPKNPLTQKSPWITINGQDVADSQLALEFLMKKFSKDLRYT